MLDLVADRDAPRPVAASGPIPRWSVVVPYYNETRYLADMLASLTSQTLRPFRVVLVDNGSTDGSALLARRWARGQWGIEVELLAEPRPGQVHALKHGLDAVATEFVAICDADTLYPPHYLAQADHVFAAAPADVAAVLAHDAPRDSASPAARRKRWLYTYIVPRLLRHQAHAGGYAHSYRTRLLRAAGGYDAALWPYVVKDHELIHRVLKHGRLRYHPDLWCRASVRRADRRQVRWTLTERILYHATPFALKDWFFYRFLASRLAARAQTDIVLRQQPWRASRTADA